MRKIIHHGGLATVGIVVAVWTLVPIYHMLIMSFTPLSDAFAGRLWPERPTIENYVTVFTENHFFLQDFWIQLWNSMFAAVMTMVIVLIVALLASFAIGRLRIRFGHYVSNMALLGYLIPAAFLAIPLYKIMGDYGLLDNIWALIFGMVTFASPYAIWVFRQYSDSIPRELDEAAKIDGATPWQLLRWVFLPLMVPAMVAIGTFAFLLCWNEYLYAFLMLSTERRVTLPVAMGYFLVSDDAPWALLMATAVIYSLPPVTLYYAVRKHMVSGLTAGATKG